MVAGLMVFLSNRHAVNGVNQMRIVVRAAAFLTLLITIQLFAEAARLTQDQNETGSISGRVMLEGKPAVGLTVVATSSRSEAPRTLEGMLNPPTSLKALTDSDGHYKIEAIPFGPYRVGPTAPVLVSLDIQGQKEVTVSDTTTMENIDFSLARGGVITGRVTDSEGRPLIGEEISLSPIDASKPRGTSLSYLTDRRMYFTDDRGIYRIYGLPPGRYTVSAGSESNAFSAMFNRKPVRVKTFYPGVTDSARARPVELAAGAEASGIDIRIESGDKGFTLRGRVLDAQTGKPIADAMIAYSHETDKKNGDRSDDEDDDNDKGFDIPGGMTTTNANGEFRFDSVPAGKYKADVESLGALTGGSEFFANPVSFEVRANVDKLEIKVHSGASISGVVSVDNSEGADAVDQMAPLMLMASVTNLQSKTTSMGVGRVAADGTFKIGGLKPGRAKISSAPTGLQKFSIVRIERSGLEQPDGLDIQSNEQIVGVRVIVAPSNCSIRVHVTLQGNPTRQGASVVVYARPLSGEPASVGDANGVIADSGDLIIENVPAGEFEVIASATLPNFSPRNGVPPPSAKQTVAVTRGIQAEVSVVLNLSAPPK